MLVLLIFSFIAGLVTILSPCILPVLPILLSGSFSGGKKRPYGIVAGFVVSFTLFTLALTTIVRATGIPSDSLRILSVLIIFAFGFLLIFPTFQAALENKFSGLLAKIPQSQDTGLVGGLLVGASLGLVWTPCVGPIIASVIALAATSQITLAAVFITFAYSLGTAIPMLVITFTGRGLLNKFPGIVANTVKVQQIFGVIMMLTAVGIFFDYDRKFQTYVLEKFPQYGAGLTSIEDNEIVEKELEKLGGTRSISQSDIQKKSGPKAPEIIEGGEWFNSEPLKISELKGKVVLIDFWTYTCINCIRTLPFLRDWHEKYEDDGLVIIGVHTPEFEFEKSARNVANAIEDFELEYPVIQDNNYATWRNYSNRYWPAKYLIDKDGRIRYTHFGEGKYDETERMIQELLAEAGSEVSDTQINEETYSIYSRTPETYLGYWRIDGFASPGGVKKDNLTEYSLPTNLKNNNFAYTGDWTIAYEYSQPQAGATLEFNFESKNVFLVMRPVGSSPGQVEVYLDGELVDTVEGGNDAQTGTVNVDTDRLYEIIEQLEPGKGRLKLKFLDSNVEIFAFTFG